MRRVDLYDKISTITGIPEKDLPRNFQIIGKSIIINFRNNSPENKGKIAKAYLATLKLWSVYEIGRIDDAMRIPSTELLAGVRTPMTNVEDGIIYRFDPSVIMFSKGNKFERHRLTGKVRLGETVVDMFAGIGYFSIPIAPRVKRIYSCEINPVSFHYLIMNKKLNHAENLFPYLGNSGDFPYENVADRVIMGHFDSLQFLAKAFRILKNEGTIHLHAAERRNSELIGRKLDQLKEVVKYESRKVKSYSPSTNHMVYDIYVNKNKCKSDQ